MTESQQDPTVTTTTETTVEPGSPDTQPVEVETPAKDTTEVDVPSGTELADAPSPDGSQDA